MSDTSITGLARVALRRRKARGVRIAVAALALLFAHAGFAQLQLEPLAAVQQSEASTIGGTAINSVPYSPDLDLYFLCFGAGSGRDYGFVDTNFDGVADIMRQYGASMVSAAQWADAGPRLLAPLRNEATLRAQGALTQSIRVAVSVANGLSDSWDLSGSEVDELRRSHEVIDVTANEVLRGSGVSGMRLVSLPSQTDPAVSDGVCLVVRYDAPLDVNGMSMPRVAPGPAGSGPAGGSSQEPQYQPPAPGVAGDL